MGRNLWQERLSPPGRVLGPEHPLLCWPFVAFAGLCACGGGAEAIGPHPAEATRRDPPGVEAIEYHPALGRIDHLPSGLTRLLDVRRFEPKRPPQRGEWLAEHPEEGQTYGEYVLSGPNRPDDARKIIDLQPIGDFGARAPELETLRAFAQDYFQLDVRLLPVLPLEDQGFTERKNPWSGERQLLTGDILDALGSRLADDAFCLLGITMVDLYPDEDWNFVFGQASLHGRVGVYSFARYDDDDPTQMLRRSVKVLAHETGHMFGIHHCIHFECGMNGSNHLQEADSQPIHLCPVCLLKLHYAVGFDPRSRYEALADRYDALALHREANWIRAVQLAPELAP